ncbi:f19ac401-9618-4b72-ba1d-f03b0ba5a691 [Thermothielavioides terrestris]|uniref:F19ac401-9618-4b72-ba1d-f03b0ba5a691 n=1 Tax=Thermothielavioides terrestris TaxID=2587410 RepID=A0A446BJY3_9PEZI|nr:f19ac401-9618-4b72-ba1d-f03b0ba5a691 [Thermothielavioides terrestris]
MAQRYAKDQPAGFSNRIERVAVVGAGGQLGKYFAQELVKTGRHTVTALTRRGSTNKLADGVKAVPVDYDDEQSLVDALKNQQFLVITLPLVRAAAAAGVRYIMPNYYGSDIANEKLFQGDRLSLSLNPARFCGEIEATGVSSWTVLVCGLWYEYSLILGPMCLGFDHAQKKMTFYDDGNTKINMTTFEQCGRAVAGLVSLKELPDDENDTSPTVSSWRNKPLYVSSFLVSQRDMFESWKRATGETDADWTIEHEPSEERHRRGLALSRESADPLTVRMGLALASFARIFFPDGHGAYETTRGLANDALGLPKEDLDERTRVAKKMLDEGYQQWVISRLQSANDQSELAEAAKKQK